LKFVGCRILKKPRNAYKILVRKLETKLPLLKLRRRQGGNNITMDLTQQSVKAWAVFKWPRIRPFFFLKKIGAGALYHP
jgi:hypothetical protein